jgi:glutamate synthase (NADPH/NADH) small chain
MGKPTGFLEYQRAPKHERPPLERVKDWSETHPAWAEETLRQQGARCMDCGIPFCHTGTLIAGMASGCPINNLIPEWNDLVYRGQWREAFIRLAKTNNFPEFTGRVCPAPCEGSCTCGLNGDPVTIKTIEAEIIDRAFAEGWVVAEPPPVRTGKRVAVVGSGPAGLACAAQLNKAGHVVTVFERADRIGGLLMYGIPNMKLDKAVVQRRVKLLADEGIRFVTSTEIGKHISADRLVKDYEAVVLCGGATAARDLPVEGRQLQGIHLAMEFLHQNTRSLLDSGLADGQYLSARGKHVVVIGGGDTGTDCVGTSLRHGARSVTQLEILPRPPDQRAADNPWPQWPKVYKLDYGQEEARALQGADPRQYQVLTTRFVGDPGGRVQSLHLVSVEWRKGADGRFGPHQVPGSERVIPADLVLLALGFTGPEKTLPGQLQCKLDDRGNVWTDADKMTSVPGIFAAGDMARGQSLVVWAIREGRLAAQSVDRYLSHGETVLTA